MTSERAAEGFVDALRRAGATIVEVVSHQYPGQGLTCVAILEESHAVLHTWPEAAVVHIDIFTCSASLNSAGAIAELAAIFEAAAVEIREVPRAADATVRGSLT